MRGRERTRRHPGQTEMSWDRTDRPAIGVIEPCAGALKGRCHDLLQFVRLDPDALAGFFEHVPEIIQILLQPFVPGALFIIHFGTSLTQKLGVGLCLNRCGNRISTSALYSARIEAIGDPLLNHLTDRTELSADGFGLSDQRCEDDIFLPLLTDEVPAIHLWGGLKFSVNATVTLFEP